MLRGGPLNCVWRTDTKGQVAQRGSAYRNMQFHASTGPEPAVPGDATSDRLGPLSHSGQTEVGPPFGP